MSNHAPKYAINERPITLGEWYEGRGVDDPSGRYYTYDDAPHAVRWISTAALAVRAKKI